MNTDITKCTNKDCPLRGKCLRFVIKPNELKQSYQRFQFKKRFDSNQYDCDFFKPLSNES